jgi:hypothetical protein
MLAVLWNPHGFRVMTMLPPGELFNASWFRDHNLVPLIQSFFPSGWSPRQKLMVHVDNAPIHKSRMTQNFFEHNPQKRFPSPSLLIKDTSLGLLSFWENQKSANRTIYSQ